MSGRAVVTAAATNFRQEQGMELEHSQHDTPLTPARQN